MLDCVTLPLEFHLFFADFMFIWSLLMLVILPDWFFPLYLLFCGGFSSHLIPFHYIGAHHIERFTAWQCYFSTLTYSYTLLSAMYFCLGVFRQYHLFIIYHYPFIVPNLYSCYLPHFFSTLSIPYINISVHFHLLVVIMVLANKPLYNFLHVFNFSLCLFV